MWTWMTSGRLRWISDLISACALRFQIALAPAWSRGWTAPRREEWCTRPRRGRPAGGAAPRGRRLPSPRRNRRGDCAPAGSSWRSSRPTGPTPRDGGLVCVVQLRHQRCPAAGCARPSVAPRTDAVRGRPHRRAVVRSPPTTRGGRRGNDDTRRRARPLGQDLPDAVHIIRHHRAPARQGFSDDEADGFIARRKDENVTGPEPRPHVDRVADRTDRAPPLARRQPLQTLSPSWADEDERRVSGTMLLPLANEQVLPLLAGHSTNRHDHPGRAEAELGAQLGDALRPHRVEVLEVDRNADRRRRSRDPVVPPLRDLVIAVGDEPGSSAARMALPGEDSWPHRSRAGELDRPGMRLIDERDLLGDATTSRQHACHKRMHVHDVRPDVLDDGPDVTRGRVAPSVDAVG